MESMVELYSKNVTAHPETTEEAGGLFLNVKRPTGKEA